MSEHKHEYEIDKYGDTTCKHCWLNKKTIESLDMNNECSYLSGNERLWCLTHNMIHPPVDTSVDSKQEESLQQVAIVEHNHIGQCNECTYWINLYEEKDKSYREGIEEGCRRLIEKANEYSNELGKEQEK
jgi:hypothetical protein